ncbi:hypothetical protein PENANT_c026G03216 [Penicillium antarcticum]|uniref:Peptidase S1 domain-containing protein n=1 Tax=Penicillium antarcticum TaxID=416450 RepID=A0A1V6PYU9_9EURO|nr:trypsin-like cysteine/serine peptidase domain-containing protein [Penicillium antarcticum]KAJ5319819.1 trypsin-like cysteine/serine peptidase domain-containing protein [Penicillium antarcticum]OQD81666.1 hypothetical protein PENANT_c026G03216 [Penicillium antarcticum]
MKPTQGFSNLLCLASLIAQPVNAIVGGSDVSAGDAPFAAAIISSTNFGNTYICGGSLISSKTVLTSAYCVDGSSASSLRARVGSLEHASGGKVNQVIKVIKHPNYNTNTRDFDYAILHLQDAVPDITPALIANEKTESGAPLTLYGWGSTDKDSEKIPNKLQQLGTTYITSGDCNSMWSDTIAVTYNMNCDAAPEKGRGSCTKDQGGAVVNELGEIIGVMGQYNYCDKASNGRPDINSDTLPAKDWIDQNTI